MSEDKAHSTLEHFVNGAFKFCQLIGNALSAYHKWYIKNADTIEQYILAFANLGHWYAAVKVLADHQIVFTEDLTTEQITAINNGDNVDEIVEKHFFSNNSQHINDVICRCQMYVQLTSYAELFTQITAAYEASHFHLACIGMFAVVDCVLADFSENSKTNYKSRIEDIEKKIDAHLELNDLDKKTLCIMRTITSFEEYIFKSHPFSENEPDGLNRHWVIHGRTRRMYDRMDFLKIVLWLDAIAFLDRKISSKT